MACVCVAFTLNDHATATASLSLRTLLSSLILSSVPFFFSSPIHVCSLFERALLYSSGCPLNSIPPSLHLLGAGIQTWPTVLAGDAPHLTHPPHIVHRTIPATLEKTDTVTSEHAKMSSELAPEKSQA